MKRKRPSYPSEALLLRLLCQSHYDQMSYPIGVIQKYQSPEVSLPTISEKRERRQQSKGQMTVLKPMLLLDSKCAGSSILDT